MMWRRCAVCVEILEPLETLISRVSPGGEEPAGGMRHCPFRQKILIFASGREIPRAYPALPRVTVKVLQPGVVMLPARTVSFGAGGPELRFTIS